MHIYDDVAKRNHVFDNFHSFVLDDDDDNDNNGGDDDAYGALYRMCGVSLLSRL